MKRWRRPPLQHPLAPAFASAVESLCTALTASSVRNYNIAVREWNDQIIFLRKIVKGGADKSYGIQVARLAGLPPEVIARAKEVLSNLELAELNADGKPKLAEKPPVYTARKRRKAEPAAEPAVGRPQMSLF